MINYNYYVDAILEMAPPYQHESEGAPELKIPSSIHSSYFEDSGLNSSGSILPDSFQAREASSEEEDPPLLAKLDSMLIPNPSLEEYSMMKSTFSLMSFGSIGGLGNS